jgi:hypothetical protein
LCNTSAEVRPVTKGLAVIRVVIAVRVR